MRNVIVVDVEAGPAPIPPYCMREFGAVHYESRQAFHATGTDMTNPGETMLRFEEWIRSVVPRDWHPVFVSDNPAYDWQWINAYFWQYLGRNPFGHSARRIGDFYAGLVGDFWKASRWKRLRVTKHDHNPVHDALGNVEALQRMLAGER